MLSETVAVEDFDKLTCRSQKCYRPAGLSSSVFATKETPNLLTWTSAVLGGKGPLGTGSDEQEAKDAEEIVLARAEMDPDVLRGPCQPERSSWGVFSWHEFLEGLRAWGQVARSLFRQRRAVL